VHNNTRIIIGVDEVNYSPSACGDCVVCACMLMVVPPRGVPIKDSKQTTLPQRLRAFEWLQVNSLYLIEVAGVNHIGRIGIYAARNLAMYRAIHGVLALRSRELRGRHSVQQRTLWEMPPYQVVVDGNEIPELKDLWATDPPRNAELMFMVAADAKVKTVSAASIIARVYADALFEGWEAYWPGYGMNKDHGSLSELHKGKLKNDGPCTMHRTRNYAPGWWAQLLGATGGQKNTTP
jgi:ribonuclease HII